MFGIDVGLLVVVHRPDAGWTAGGARAALAAPATREEYDRKPAHGGKSGLQAIPIQTRQIGYATER